MSSTEHEPLDLDQVEADYLASCEESRITGLRTSAVLDAVPRLVAELRVARAVLACLPLCPGCGRADMPDACPDHTGYPKCRACGYCDAAASHMKSGNWTSVFDHLDSVRERAGLATMRLNGGYQARPQCSGLQAGGEADPPA